MEFSARVDEILKEWDVDYLNLLNNSKEYRYIDIGFKNINYFSYIPKDKIKYLKDISESNLIYSSELRTKYAVEIKPTRLMNKILKEPITTKQSEKLLGIIGKYDNYEFHCVGGQEIKKYYNKDSYDGEECIMLNNSCMNGKIEYLDFYVDSAKLLIFKNPNTNKIAGRALLWKAKLDGNEIEFMDRVYADNIVEVKFMLCAIKNKFYFRNSSNCAIFHFEDKDYYTQDFDLRLDIDVDKYKYMPYMDTFFIQKKGYLSAQDCYNTLQNSVGGFYYCPKCGNKILEYQERQYYSWELKKEVCEKCSNKKDIEINGKFYKLADNSIRYCTICKKYHLEVDMKGWRICKTCWNEKYVKINGRKYSKKGKKVYYNEEKGRWMLK